MWFRKKMLAFPLSSRLFTLSVHLASRNPLVHTQLHTVREAFWGCEQPSNRPEVPSSK